MENDQRPRTFPERSRAEAAESEAQWNRAHCKESIQKLPVFMRETEKAIFECQRGFLDEIQKLRSEDIKELRDKLESLQREKTHDKLWYAIPLLFAVAVTAILVIYGWAQKPTVSIQYNVGEIIGGVLAGVGALVAGVTYAIRRMGGA